MTPQIQSRNRQVGLALRMLEFRLMTPTATDEEIASIVNLRRLLDAELGTRGEPVPPRRAHLDLTASAPLMKMRGLAAWDGPTAVGLTSMWLWYGTRNRTLGEGELSVHPAHRRRGIATHLATQTARFMRDDGRETMLMYGLESKPNVRFWKSLGHDVGYREKISRLDIASVNPELMEDWIRRASERAGDISLVRWKGQPARHLLPAFRLARDAMNDAPIGTLDYEKGLDPLDEVWGSGAMLETSERSCWTVAAMTTNGEMAGYTTTTIDLLAPSLSWQGDTGVMREHRGRGIGRWLKAAMWRWIADEAPTGVATRTENADTNAAMLAINQEMGFEPWLDWAGWQPDLGALAISPVQVSR